MSVRIFVSSTCRDLDQDYRPEVIDALRTAEVVSVNMEDWEANYLLALDLCEQQLSENSSHYLGVYSYWRGWVPPGETRSITEIEYDMALEKRPRERIAIFLPRNPSRAHSDLRRRARRLKQDAAQEAAQEAFLERVRNSGGVVFFPTLPKLAVWSYRKARSWSQGRLRGLASQDDAARNRLDRPGEDDLDRLGFDIQLARFNAVVAKLAVAAGAEVACFLIHGRAGWGQDRLARRLAREIESKATPTPLEAVAGIGTLWRADDPRQLVRPVSEALGLGDDVDSVAALAAALVKPLASTDVILRVSDVHRYPGGVAGFATEFWRPLVAALPPVERRLIGIATVAGAQPGAADGSWLARDDHAAPAGDVLVPLPRLSEISHDQLVPWLRTWIPTRTDAQAMAKALIDETEGVPHLLYTELLKATTWNR